MNSTTKSQMATLQATANTRQCHNAFFRRHQLKCLHDTFRASSSEIISAIKKNTNVSQAEATTEFALALDIIKDHYNSINTTNELEYENRVAQGKDAADRRAPWGVVYIEPDLTHTPFFSVVVTLSAAVAAGNCVALKLENNLRTLPSLMRNLLPKALNADMLAIISTNPSPESIQTCLQVLPRSTIAIPRYNQLAPSCRHVVGIVDRSADIASAAKHLVAARFTFNGTSPYAPDIVFVNEFVIKEFTESVLQQSIPFLAASPTSQKDEKNNGKKQDFGAEYEKEDWRVSIVTQGAAGSIVRLENSSSNGNVALPAKKSTPVFAITAITSPDHAIDLVASTPLLAAYHFGEPAHANYLTKFVSAEATFVNHIPTQLLLGPPASSFQPFNLESRYTVEHFSKLSPAFTSSYVKRQNTSTTAAISSEKDAGKLLRDATEPVKEEKRKESLSVGFFEQGIMIGAGVYGLPLLACISVGLYYSVRAGMQAVSLLR